MCIKIDNYSLLEVVDDKLACKKHTSIGSPLSKAEMLSLILYTGCVSK